MRETKELHWEVIQEKWNSKVNYSNICKSAWNGVVLPVPNLTSINSTKFWDVLIHPLKEWELICYLENMEFKL